MSHDMMNNKTENMQKMLQTNVKIPYYPAFFWGMPIKFSVRLPSFKAEFHRYVTNMKQECYHWVMTYDIQLYCGICETVKGLANNMTTSVIAAHLGACHHKGGMVLEKQLSNFSIVVHGCSMNGFLSTVICGINVCSQLQQQPTNLQLPRSWC